jgi:hypothetical protein
MKTLSIIAGVIIGYFGLTWFFFGSSHPCGILEARQKPYVIRTAEKSWFGELKNWSNLMKETNFESSVVDAATKHITTRSQQQREAMRKCAGGSGKKRRLNAYGKR